MLEEKWIHIVVQIQLAAPSVGGFLVPGLIDFIVERRELMDQAYHGSRILFVL